MSILTQDINTHWAAISPLLAIHTEAQYEAAIQRLNGLLDEIGTNEGHPLYELLDTLGVLVHAYEERHYPVPPQNGCAILEYLMTEHDLSQAELPEIGSQGVVSEILHGKRELNVRQIRVLAQRFGISPAVFF